MKSTRMGACAVVCFEVPCGGRRLVASFPVHTVVDRDLRS
jgi:hypothetical protein